MIEVSELKKAFKAPSSKGKFTVGGLLKKAPVNWVTAVANVSFSAPDGQITGLLGPNGAGKTTSLRMLAGLIAPDGGNMAVDGIDVRTLPQQALQRMGLLSDARS